MEQNLNFVDISIRYALIMVLGITFGFTLWYSLIVVAVLLLMTAVSGICPIYKLMGIDHRPEKN